MHSKFRKITFKGNGDGVAARKQESLGRRTRGRRVTAGQREEGHMLFVKSDHF